MTSPDFMLASVRRHRVLLVVHGPPRDDEAVLEHGRRVAEDEVDGPRDDAVAEELPPRVHVQRVLERVEPAVEEGRLVALHPERHRLVPLRAGRVVESHVLADEPRSLNSCDQIKCSLSLPSYPYHLCRP
jgi:hypothetical protein